MAFPAWSVSLAFHCVLGLILLSQVDRRGIPDGHGFGLGSGTRQLTATFSSTELPGDAGGGGTGVTAEIVAEGPPSAASTQGFETVPAEEEPPLQPEPSQEDVVEVPSAYETPPEQLVSEEGPARRVEASQVEDPLTATRVDSQTARVTPRLASVQNRNADGSAGAGPGNSLERNGTGDLAGRGGRGTGDGGDPRFGSPDGTSFFQIRGQGQHFCYVVDCSSSMEDGNTIGVVRTELIASLQRLEASKRFQILFYDSELHPLTDGRKTIFQATESNRRFARQFIRGQQPTGRALHQPALTAALQSRPDVIFFLTDGEVPELTARQLYELKAANQSRTRIHVIEFGKGVKLETNWLEKLARDHQGSYRYEDIDLQ